MRRLSIVMALVLLLSLSAATLALAAADTIGYGPHHQQLLNRLVQDGVLPSDKAAALGEYFRTHCPALLDANQRPVHSGAQRGEMAKLHEPLLQQAVQDGVLTQTESDAVREYWAANCPAGQGMGTGRNPNCPRNQGQ